MLKELRLLNIEDIVRVLRLSLCNDWRLSLEQQNILLNLLLTTEIFVA